MQARKTPRQRASHFNYHIFPLFTERALVDCGEATEAQVSWMPKLVIVLHSLYTSCSHMCETICLEKACAKECLLQQAME